MNAKIKLSSFFIFIFWQQFCKGICFKLKWLHFKLKLRNVLNRRHLIVICYKISSMLLFKGPTPFTCDSTVWYIKKQSTLQNSHPIYSSPQFQWLCFFVIWVPTHGYRHQPHCSLLHCNDDEWSEKEELGFCQESTLNSSVLQLSKPDCLLLSPRDH